MMPHRREQTTGDSVAQYSTMSSIAKNIRLNRRHTVDQSKVSKQLQTARDPKYTPQKTDP